MPWKVLESYTRNGLRPKGKEDWATGTLSTLFGAFSESSLLVNALPSPTTEGCMHFNELFIISQARSLTMTNEYRWLFLLSFYEETRECRSSPSQIKISGDQKKKKIVGNLTYKIVKAWRPRLIKPWSTAWDLSHTYWGFEVGGFLWLGDWGHLPDELPGPGNLFIPSGTSEQRQLP